ncbi:hypothetical protein [Burkholderia sp. PAMC 26561]|uniref:hypothetical protein n=1 Tax=Burkholderia sp. PAMC 26561 TaxID=1795043 RepID=UPI0013C42DB5|nr:hypothetical protein [Burkholderia sp. PAMC 26561]
MNRPKNQRRAPRSARRWAVKVREAEAELVYRIAHIEAGLNNLRESADRVSMLTRLRQRLARIVDRYGSILD